MTEIYLSKTRVIKMFPRIFDLTYDRRSQDLRLYRMMKIESFPLPIERSKGFVWKKSSIERWVVKNNRQSDCEPIKLTAEDLKKFKKPENKPMYDWLRILRGEFNEVVKELIEHK